MTSNKRTVEKYIEGFNKSDHEQILSCLTDDVVVAEGSVRARRRDGGELHAVFCDVFTMKDAKIKHLISYLTELK